ncbi:MAG: cyclase family protein [Candidatus Kerfeldbacteria bacterium]|nr:cyclase family protein [Candidatus Kerfeldbacteria bacterium]
MPVYPGDLEPRLVQTASLEKEGYVDFQLTSGMHVGTHVDAPAHMVANGKMLDAYPVDWFTGAGVLIDARGATALGVELLDGVTIPRNAVVLFATGWDEKYRTPAYFTDFPVMTEGCAQALCDADIRIVGTDTASPDRPPFAVHRILLRHDILILENLTNLSALRGTPFTMFAFPPRLATEAAPVRVVARVSETQ